MIDIYTGTPGSGKSLNAVKKILQRLMMRRRTILNFEIELPGRLGRLARMPIVWDNSMVLVENFVEFARKHHKKNAKGRVYEGQTLVVLDECQLMFDPELMKENDTRKIWKWFFTQHRKLGFDFLLITQHINNIDPAIRKLLERETIHFKVENNPSGKMFMLLLWLFTKLLGITLFISVTRWIKFDIKMFRKTGFFTYRAWLANIYNTSNMFEADSELEASLILKARENAGGAPLGEDRRFTALEKQQAEEYAKELVGVSLLEVQTTEWGARIVNS
ncbi:MAG: zonular occludens toxin domain-containing protein [Oscillospiraceae bacterium]|nr:zonular occludens toxin domain-containing protein [Oscillospiraceae bacterium]